MKWIFNKGPFIGVERFTFEEPLKEDYLFDDELEVIQR